MWGSVGAGVALASEGQGNSQPRVGMVGEGSPQDIGNGSPVVHNPRGSKILSETPSPGKGPQSDPLPSPSRTLLYSVQTLNFSSPPFVPGLPRSLSPKGIKIRKFVRDPFTMVPGFLSQMPLPQTRFPLPRCPEKDPGGQSPILAPFCPRYHGTDIARLPTRRPDPRGTLSLAVF